MPNLARRSLIFKEGGQLIERRVRTDASPHAGFPLEPPPQLLIVNRSHFWRLPDEAPDARLRTLTILSRRFAVSGRW